MLQGPSQIAPALVFFIPQSDPARGSLLLIMLNEPNAVVVNESELAIIHVRHPDDIAVIRDYALPRAERGAGKATDNNRRGIIVNAQMLRRNRITC